MSGRIEESVWEVRRAWIAKQQQSGWSVAKFYRAHGLHARNFHSWKCRSGEAAIGPLASKSTVVSTRKQRQDFVQLAAQELRRVVWHCQTRLPEGYHAGRLFCVFQPST